MTTSKKKISNKTSLFFEENKQRLSNAKQRLWIFDKWVTSPSFTVLLIKHNEYIQESRVEISCRSVATALNQDLAYATMYYKVCKP